jgi:hypothetical protein
MNVFIYVFTYYVMFVAERTDIEFYSNIWYTNWEPQFVLKGMALYRCSHAHAYTNNYSDEEYHLLGYDTLHNHRCENLKFYNYSDVLYIRKNCSL